MAKTGKLVNLKLDGELENQGFKVSLQIGSDGEPTDVELTGFLPKAPELLSHYQQWQKLYLSLGGIVRLNPKEIVYKGHINNNLDKCRQLENKLGDLINNWLESKSFRKLDKRLREKLAPDESIRLLICSEDRQLHKMPWYLWDFIDRYPNSEVAFGCRAFEQVKICKKATGKNKVRILAILGHSEGIDIDSDRTMLSALPDAEVEFLVEPQRKELNDYLWNFTWDILFFAGS